VTAKLWLFIFAFEGIGNKLFNTTVLWTGSEWPARWAVIIADVWKTTPFMALLILAALQMLPRECYEAALLDGTHPLKVFWRVTLPLVRPALMVAVIFRAIDALRVFDVIYVLTGANEQSMTMSIYARQQLFEFNLAGYGSSASTLLFFIIALATIGLLVATRVRLGDE
jgi:multiple sugar transport system permease protein